MNIRNTLNIIYQPLVKKAESIYNIVTEQYNKAFYSFYNNHFHKNEIGEYIVDYFPIPVISIENICDIEFDLDTINVTSKLTKHNTVEFDYSKLNNFKFEIYGVNDYLTDYYTNDSSLDQAIAKIGKSNETEFFFTFYFNNDTDEKALLIFLAFLQKEKFFY